MSAVAQEVRAARPAVKISDFLASATFFWLVLAVYLLAHVVLRMWETPNIGKNDVQEAIAAQGWAWGYHPRNPPLHTWLLMSFYGIFGVSPIAHFLLKYLLLGATSGFAYLSARRLLSSPAMATLSALSLTLLTPFAWTVHTALTHTLLLAAINFATLWAVLRLTQERRLLDYVVFGVVVGLGLLAKYSFALFVLPLIAAMLTQREFRRALSDVRIAVAVLVAAMIVAPHALWMLTTRFDFAGFLAEKQQSAELRPYVQGVAEGAVAVVVGALGFLGPMAIAAGVLYAGARRRAAAPISPWARTLALAVAFGVAALLLDVLVLRATQFEERYFFCALLLSPLVLFQWLERRGFDAIDLRWIGASVMIVALVAGGGLVGRSLLWHHTCNRCWDELPVSALERAVRTAGFTGGTIISDHYNVAGNMRIRFPEARTIAVNYEMATPLTSADGQCLLVWDARIDGDAMPRALSDYLAGAGLVPTGAPRYVDALLLRDRERMDRFAYWLVPNADGNCRPR